jgi:hypothetical protein
MARPPFHGCAVTSTVEAVHQLRQQGELQGLAVQDALVILDQLAEVAFDRGPPTLVSLTDTSHQ